MAAFFFKRKRTFYIRIYEINPDDPSQSIIGSHVRTVCTWTKDEARYTAEAVIAIHNKKRDYHDPHWCHWQLGKISTRCYPC